MAGAKPGAPDGPGDLADETADHESGTVAPGSASAADADAPMGPGADEEAAFLATQHRTDVVLPPPIPAERGQPPKKHDLPPLDSLVSRIPADARAALDELFRAKFTAVRRMPETALKRE